MLKYVVIVDPSFVTHDELCEYLENDCIRFEVEVTLS